MKFKLSKVSENRSVTKFRITDEAQGVVGSVTVPRSQADDLVRSWGGLKDIAPQRGSAAAMARALKPMPLAKAKAAILRSS
jgi:hypothetical protein